MLQTVGQGTVLDAVIKSGFKNVYDDLDCARFELVDSEGAVNRLSVFCERLNSADALPTKKRDGRALVLAMARLPLELTPTIQRLIAAGCTLNVCEPATHEDRPIARLSRVDSIDAAGGKIVTRVSVIIQKGEFALLDDPDDPYASGYSGC